MKNQKLSYFFIAVSMGIMLLSISCKKSSHKIDPTPVLTGVKLTDNTTFGKILTDNNGFSLYFFSKDVSGTSNCAGGCATTWPVFYKENLTIGTGLTTSDFGTIDRADGSKQSTYKGWPLYYYMNDTKAGDTNGDKVANLWAIAKADYSIMFGNAQLIGLDKVQYTDQGVAGTAVSQYITDGNGLTLYMFSKDAANKNNFTKPDFSNDVAWPIYTVSAVASIPSVFDKSQFTTIDVFGRTQLVYKGHPLYHFGQDAATRGNTNGISFPTPGAAIWKITNSTTVAL
jgi:predicted lipoprotein with Yx(FWY)xxD motif